MRLPFCPGNDTPHARHYPRRFEFAPGGYFSPDLRQQAVACPACGRKGNFVSSAAGAVVVVPVGFQSIDETIWKDLIAPYLDQVVLIAWRARTAALETHYIEEGRKWREEVFYPLFPEFRDWPSTRTWVDLSEAAKALYDRDLGRENEKPPTRAVGRYLPLPVELTGPVVPPQIPEGFPATLFYASGTDAEGALWYEVDPLHSRTLPLPVDPILTAHTRYFDGVWTALEAALERPLPERKNVKNQYGGIAPWVEFEFEGVTIVVGPRKRVVAIKASSTRPLQVQGLRELAERDHTTFSLHGFPGRVRPEEIVGFEGFPNSVQEAIWMRSAEREDGTIEDPYPVGQNLLEVHAWTQTKTIAYLTLLCREILAATPKPEAVPC